MQSPITLSFRHIDRSGALEERALKFGHHEARFNGRIQHCHMTLQGPNNLDANADSQYLVKIDLMVPGAQIHADSLHAHGAGHKDIYLALRDAFNNAKRQLLGLSAAQSRRSNAAGTPAAMTLATSVSFDADRMRRYDREGPRYTSYPTAQQSPDGISPH